MGVQMHEDRYGVVAVSLTPAGTAAGPLTASQTFTVKGLKTTDVILGVQPPSTSAALILGAARVSAADTLSIQIGNFSTGPATSASGTYNVFVFRPEAVRTAVNAAIGA